LKQVCKQITAVIERVFAQELMDRRSAMSDLTIQGNLSRFLIGRMGSTGSTWLAKLLDSHPEVSCSHEGFVSQVFPRDNCSASDIDRFIQYFAWDVKHNAYRAVGDVGSAWSTHLPYLPFTTALLLRHPARLLHTRLRIYPNDQSFFPSVSESAHTCIREIWGIHSEDCDTTDQAFLYDAFIFASQVWAIGKVDMLIRIEDLGVAEYCHQTLRALTGEEYDPAIVERSISNRVNQRSGPTKSVQEIVAGFSALQRDWYHIILGDVIEEFGYSLLDDLDSDRQSRLTRAAIRSQEVPCVPSATRACD
jgi:hypothetical protein